MNKLRNFYPLLRQIIRHPNNRNNPLAGLARFVAWQAWKRLVRQPVILQVGSNRRFLAAIDSQFSSQVIYNRLPEWDEMNFLLRYLRPDDGFLDLGANVGFYTILASTIIERGPIISVEPSPRNLEILRRQIEVNALKNITLVASAIGNIDGTVPFSASLREMGSIVTQTDHPNGTLNLPCQRLDTLLAHALPPGGKIELAKMDVEGCEMLILQGATETLRNQTVRTWLFEVSENALRAHDGSARELLDRFTQSGYSLYSWDETDRKLHPVAAHARMSQANLIACLEPAHMKQRLGVTE